MTEEVSVSSRVTEAAVEQRRALVHAREPDAEEHRQQRPHAVQLRDAGAGRAVAERRRGNELGSVSGFTVNGQRPELQQHHDRWRRQHRHRRQRRQHGDDQHRLRRRVQDPDQLLPGGIRPRRRRPAPGGDQERHAATSTARATGTAVARAGTPTPGSTTATRRPTPKPDTSRNDSGYTIGGPVAFPDSTRQDRSCSSSGARSSSAASDPPQHPPRDGPDGAGAAGRLLAERRQQRQPVSVHPGLHDRPALQRRPTRADASRTAACSAGSRRTALSAPGLDVAQASSRSANFSARQRAELLEPGPRQAPRREDLLRLDYQVVEQLARHRPLHEHEGEHPAGVRDDLGRQRQRPAPDADAVPAPRQELHDVGDGRPEHHDVASRSSVGTRDQLAELRACSCRPSPPQQRGPDGVPLPVSRTRCSPTTSPGSSSAAAAPATPASTRPTVGRSPTRTSTTTSWRTSRRSGAPTPRRPASTTRTASSRRASSPASTARSTSPTTRATRSTPATATRTRRPASSTPTPRPTSSPSRNGVYKNLEFYAQDNWKPATGSRSTTACGSTT